MFTEAIINWNKFWLMCYETFYMVDWYNVHLTATLIWLHICDTSACTAHTERQNGHRNYMRSLCAMPSKLNCECSVSKKFFFGIDRCVHQINETLWLLFRLYACDAFAHRIAERVQCTLFFFKYSDTINSRTSLNSI